MDRSEYVKLTAAKAIGRKVRLLKEVRNGDFVIPAGSICTIGYKLGGFNLVGPKCELCGVQVKVTKVPHAYVQLVDEDEHFIPEESQGRGG